MRQFGLASVLSARARSLVYDEQGVVLALSLAFMLPLFVLAVCIYAVQETLVRKAELQNAADAAAYSAAVVQSDYFSRIGLVNQILGWSYVERERARADYTMARLANEATKQLDDDRNVCRKFNANSCCDKKKIENQHWGVGKWTAGETTTPYYEKYNGLKRMVGINEVRVVSQNLTSYINPAKLRIEQCGERMKKCVMALDAMVYEHDRAVDQAANEILELNMAPSKQNWYSQVVVPRAAEILPTLKCTKEDEKMLFTAAGFANPDPKVVLGLGADKWLVLAPDAVGKMDGPPWIGRQTTEDMDKFKMTWAKALKMLLAIAVIRRAYIISPLITTAALLAAIAVTIYKEVKMQAEDAKYLDTIQFLKPQRVKDGFYDPNDGPQRVLNFDGSKYLSGEYSFFWKRYAQLWLFGLHICLEPVKIIGKAHIGGYKKGTAFATIFGKRYDNNFGRNLIVRGGKPIYGEVIGAKGRRLSPAYFDRRGSIRVLLARDNPNPLRVFGSKGQAFGSDITSSLREFINRMDGLSIYQIFNTHISTEDSATATIFEGSQAPNFLYAVAAARCAPRSEKGVYELQPTITATHPEGSMCTTDWEPTLVSFRASGMDGWNKAKTPLNPSGDFAAAFSSVYGFGAEMRGEKAKFAGLGVSDAAAPGWRAHVPIVSGMTCNWMTSELRKSAPQLQERIGTVHGPLPFTEGSTTLNFDDAERLIRH